MAPSYPDHGGLSSGEDALMAVTAEVAKGPHLRLVWLREKVNEVRGVLAELCSGYCWLWCSGKPARARWSNGDGGGPLRLRRESEGERENEM